MAQNWQIVSAQENSKLSYVYPANDKHQAPTKIKL